MRTDSELKTDLIERFDMIPSINKSDIGVHVEDGMVTLTGEVDTNQTRFQLERAARKVAGVRGLHMHVRPVEKTPQRGHR